MVVQKEKLEFIGLVKILTLSTISGIALLCNVNRIYSKQGQNSTLYGPNRMVVNSSAPVANMNSKVHSSSASMNKNYFVPSTA